MQKLEKKDLPEQVVARMLAGELAERGLRRAQLLRRKLHAALELRGCVRDVVGGALERRDVASPRAVRPGRRGVESGEGLDVLDEQLQARPRQRGKPHVGQAVDFQTSRRVARQVYLVEHHRDGDVATQRGARRGRRLRFAGGDVGDPEHAVGGAGLVAGPAHAFDLDGVGCVAHSGRVDDRERETVERDPLPQRVARGPRNLGHDRGVVTRERVEQARLARVRRPGDRQIEPVAQHGAVLRFGEEGAQRGLEALEVAAQRADGSGVDLLVGEVEPRLERDARRRQRRLRLGDARGEPPAQRAQRGSRGSARAAADEMRSATASACARSSLSFRNARFVNSPGSAGRAPAA